MGASALSPKDGFVAKINAQNGDTVQADSVIIQLDSTQETLNLARITSIDQLRAIFAKRLQGPAVDIARRLSQIAVDTAKRQETAKAQAADIIRTCPQIGTNVVDNFCQTTTFSKTTYGSLTKPGSNGTGTSGNEDTMTTTALVGRFEFLDLQAAIDIAPLSRESAEQNKALFEYLISELTDVNKLVQAHLGKETDAVNAQIASLSVRALAAGKLHNLSVRQGSFIKKGDLLFEIL